MRKSSILPPHRKRIKIRCAFAAPVFDKTRRDKGTYVRMYPRLISAENLFRGIGNGSG